MLLVYGEKCLSCKTVYNSMGKFSQTTCRCQRHLTWSRSMDKTAILWTAEKEFYAAGIGAMIKGWDRYINVAGDCRKVKIVSNW